jgi:hypothetical protein
VKTNPTAERRGRKEIAKDAEEQPKEEELAQVLKTEHSETRDGPMKGPPIRSFGSSSASSA